MVVNNGQALRATRQGAHGWLEAQLSFRSNSSGARGRRRANGGSRALSYARSHTSGPQRRSLPSQMTRLYFWEVTRWL